MYATLVSFFLSFLPCLIICICLGPAEYGDSDINGRKHIGGVIGYEKPRLKVSKSTTPGPGAYDVK